MKSCPPVSEDSFFCSEYLIQCFDGYDQVRFLSIAQKSFISVIDCPEGVHRAYQVTAAADA